ARHPGARATFVVKASLCEVVTLAGIADATVAVEGAETARLFAGDRPPTWLEGRPRLYSWLGCDDPEVRHRLAPMTRGARFFRVERGEGPVHAAVAYACPARCPAAPDDLAAGSAIAAPPSPSADALLARAGRPVLAVHPGA